MDHRIALKPDTTLHFSNDRGEVIHCVIESEIGRGASCIVYEASRVAETGDKTLYRVKEFYPYRLHISREDDGTLIPTDEDAAAFEDEQKKLLSDFSCVNQLFYSAGNYALMTNQLDAFKQNGTYYVLYAYSSKETLASYKPESLKECITLVKQVAHALGLIHAQGFLYLDVKPDNVLVVDGLPKRVQLFDFDSLVSIRDLESAGGLGNRGIRLSYTRGFAPVELQTLRVNRLGPHTDVYGVGALLFYLLFGYTPNAPACEKDAEYDFSGSLQYSYEEYDDRLFGALEGFFHSSLAVYYKDRYEAMQDVVQCLQEIEKYADPLLPRVFSTKISRPKVFYGREDEFNELDRLIAEHDYNCIFVTGMGGIGKSTFIREYLVRRRQQFDTVLYVQFKGNVRDTISDDNNIQINTLNLADEAKSGQQYFGKKVKKLRDLVRGTLSVLVIDNFDGTVDEDLRAVLETDLRVILLSRRAPSYQESYEMRLSAVSDDALRSIFEDNLGRPIADSEQASFKQIVSQVDRHTLVIELIAKQIASSHITIQSAAALTGEHGFSSIAPEKIEYEKDNQPSSATIGNIVDALFEANGLPQLQKTLMKVASLLGDNGIDIRLFQQIMNLGTKDDLNTLVKEGWLILSGDAISMHRVIQEAVRRWKWTEEFLRAAEQFLTYFHVEIRIESTKNNYPKKLRDSMLKMRQLEPYLNKRQWEAKERRYQERGLIGKVAKERLCRIEDILPANIQRLAALLVQSEDILTQCKREPEVKACDVYAELLYNTVLNLPKYNEDLFLSEAKEIFSDADFVSNGIVELLDGGDCKNPITLMCIYEEAVCIAANDQKFDEAKELVHQAKALEERVCSHKAHYTPYYKHKVHAQYYNLLAYYYDARLGGAYNPENVDEERLLDELLSAIEKARRYSKRDISTDENHLYARNTIAKATILMRSGLGTHKDVEKLLGIAKDVIVETALPYADVRLDYNLACAWHYTLIHNIELATKFITRTYKLSEEITPTDLERIDNVIIPCANMYFELKRYGHALELLFSGTLLCTEHANTNAYALRKQELCNHLWQVGIEAQQFALCQKLIDIMDMENEDIVDPEKRVTIPDEVRKIIADETA